MAAEARGAVRRRPAGLALFVLTALLVCSQALGATYFIKQGGSDSNAGTSAGAAWRTFGKALGASGIASGDTVYVGAGIYREVLTVAMTSATAETFVIGDVDGVQTGDPGVVVWTGYVTDDRTASSITATLNTGARDFLTFRNIQFESGNAQTVNIASGSTNIKIQRCAFVGGPQASQLVITPTIDIDSAIVIEESLFYKTANATINVLPPTSNTADYDCGVDILGCVFYAGANTTIQFAPSGALANDVGGVRIIGCTSIQRGAFLTTAANSSTTIPCVVEGCFLSNYDAVVMLNANASGQITEDWNDFLCILPRTNVTAGTRSRAGGLTLAPRMWVGQERLWGMTQRNYGEPMDVAGWLGSDTSSLVSATSIYGLPRASGTVKHGPSGTATAGAAGTITDSGASFGIDKHRGWMVRLTGGTGSGQVKLIASHTNTVITVNGNWTTTPDNTTTYQIYWGPAATSGTATSGSTTTIVQSSATWATDYWTGLTVECTSGTGSGQTAVITSNTGTTLTFPAVGTGFDNTSVFVIYRATSIDTSQEMRGATARPQTWVSQTAVARTGTYASASHGPGVQDFSVNLADGVAYTLSAYLRFNSSHAGTKPQLLLVNGTEAGCADATDTITAAADTWEQATVTCTPTSNGRVTLRLQCNSTNVLGVCYADDLAVAD